MCGRFTYKLTWPEIVKLYRLSLDAPARNTQPRYNICPTTTIDTVIGRKGARALVPMRWGLIPSWWSKPLKEMKLATFNARVETVTDKLMFRKAFKCADVARFRARSKAGDLCRICPSNRQPERNDIYVIAVTSDGQPCVSCITSWQRPASLNS
jgi:hypothetical protein